MPLDGMVAIVTGSSRGIGYAIAKQMGLQGARIIVNSRNEVQIRKAAEELRKEGIEARGVSCDVHIPEQANLLVEAALEEWGTINILVNNAGINRDKLLLRMTEEDWDQVIDVNLKGNFNCTKAVARSMMKNRWGRIINVSSVIGIMGNPGQANYAAAKAGIVGFTKTVAKELGSKNITANVIAPGFIKTEMTKNLKDNVKEELMNRIPLGRFGESQDVANLAAFIASEEASYITGQVFVVDGGLAL